MRKKTRLIHGVGVNDADYAIKKKFGETVILCPFYLVWAEMLRRCYSAKFKARNKTYADCCAANDWLTFSNFKSWMELQDWRNKEIDKDILVVGNKIYSPETCVFVSHATNSFLLNCGSSRGDHPVGVHWNLKERSFQAYCRNPFSKKREHLGYFSCQHEAHLAWRKRKNEFACKLADLQSDQRVAEALRIRYL